MGTAAPAHAGYAWFEKDTSGDAFGVARYQSLPGERADVRLQVSGSGTTVTFEDLTSPVRAGVPPTALGQNNIACEQLSEHKARCVHPQGPPLQSPIPFNSAAVDTTRASGSRVRDLPAEGNVFVSVSSGPMADTIELDDGFAHFVDDVGGTNTITLGPHASGAWRNGIRVGPGRSTIDVQNGGLDWVQCLTPDSGASSAVLTSLGVPDPDLGPQNSLDTVFADPDDQVRDC
jgi:hypothetical protein